MSRAARATVASSLAVIACACSLLACGCSGHPPADLGVKDGRLRPCPPKPNCVSSQDPDPGHRMDPISFEGTTTRHALARLASLLIHRNRVRLTRSVALSGTEDSYLAAEFKSAVFGFVDDVEFFVDSQGKKIQFRSASRMGYTDLGANRRRMEELAKEFKAVP